LAQKYGDQVFDLKVKDYVTVTAPHDGWEHVTFKDALNMATGIGASWPQRDLTRPHGDEQQPKFDIWLRAQTAWEKLALAFSYEKYPWGPGKVLRYSSINTFVLAAAMDRFLKQQAGPNAHVWEMVVADVYQPIGVFHLPTWHTQEADGGRGIPLLGYGLYPTLGDIAKLTVLLHNGGQHQSRQLLSAAKLAEALYKTEARGLPSGLMNQFGEGQYHLSFWSVPHRTADGCSFQIPFMAGWGGNLVVLLPNGITAFRLTDGHSHDMEAVVLVGEAIRPFPCAG
jgi:CubicO group peptidase (beta-lactamase class C family)